VVRLSAFLRNPFSFFFTRSGKQERVATYVIREHERGRPLHDILEDAYVRNRLTDSEVARLLDRPEVVHALGEGVVEKQRAQLES
jgi:RecB family exonuclease